MSNYYSDKLSAERLMRVYAVASPRINQYLNAEIDCLLQGIKPSDTVLELGCGYGRIMKELLTKAGMVVGIDISPDNIAMAKEYLKDYKNVKLYQMDALNMSFAKETFDIVIVAQNGISAFKAEPEKLLRDCLYIAKKGGKIIFSTYAGKFWGERLKWFEIQAAEGLLGEIDWEKTANGKIVCKDGFTATTFTEEDFAALADKFNLKPNIYEVDASSLFCEISVP